MTRREKTPPKALTAEAAVIMQNQQRSAVIVRQARQLGTRSRAGYHLIRHQLEGAEQAQALIDRRLVPEGPTFSLAELQGAVGGHVTIAALYEGGMGRCGLSASGVVSRPADRGTPEELVLMVDEDGIHKRLPVNLRASMIAGQTILGDALLIPRGALGGDDE